MRYLNWDVLLFPRNSRVPMQEFKTACYAVHDSEVLHDDLFDDTLGYESNSRLTSFRQVPIVTCFLASQEDNSPFKVSIHSWSIPECSKDLKRLEGIGKDKIACFEARLIIDGICVGSSMMMSCQNFPEIIENSFRKINFNSRLNICLQNKEVDKNGSKDLLRWPSFHFELLTQSCWSAGENLGRIKVTIAEGFVHEKHESPFMRMKNLVTFSFQHAPLPVLESSGIAWPNKGMWMLPPQVLYNAASSARGDMLDPELHAHSPTRRCSEQKLSIDLTGSSPSKGRRHTMGPPTLPPTRFSRGVAFCDESKNSDPFTDLHQQNIGVFPKGQLAFASGYRSQDLLEELCIASDSADNQRCSSSAFSNQSFRHNSDVTMKSHSSEESERHIHYDPKVYHIPTGEIKGRKEGSASEIRTPTIVSEKLSQDVEQNELQQTDNEALGSSSSSKRKYDNVTGINVSMAEHLELQSPRKTTKLSDQDLSIVT